MDDQWIENVDVCHVPWKGTLLLIHFKCVSLVFGLFGDGFMVCVFRSVKMDGVRVQDVLKEYHLLDLNLYWRLLQDVLRSS
nr:hypothetical protein [Tanacetum cinerariifolium]